MGHDAMDGYVGIGAWVRAGVGVAVGEADSSGGDAVGDGVGKLDGSVEVLGELCAHRPLRRTP